MGATTLPARESSRLRTTTADRMTSEVHHHRLEMLDSPVQVAHHAQSPSTGEAEGTSWEQNHSEVSSDQGYF